VSNQAGSDNSKPELKKLTEREESLCQAMLVSDNQSEAFRKSKYATDKMSQATITKQASRYFQKPHIRGRMAILTQKRNERSKIDADYVIKRLAEIDQMDVKDILDDEGGLLPVNEWPKQWRITVSGIEVSKLKVGQDGSAILSKIKWPDKVKNLELIGKHVDVQAWREKIDVTVVDEEDILQKRINKVEELKKSAQQASD
jgi:phage terminase small subunit